MESQPQPSYYEITIDLRAIANTLLRWAWLILLAGLLAALAAFLTSKLVLSPQYESTALVAITEPNLIAELEPSIRVSPQMPDTKALADLAQADDLLRQVYQASEVKVLLDQGTTFGSFRGRAEATLVGTNQLRLTVTDSDPERAALIANVWASYTVNRLSELYGSTETNYDQLQKQVAIAKENWNAAQAALEAHLPDNQAELLATQLSQAQSSLRLYLDKLDQNDFLIQDAQTLSRQLEGLTATEALSSGDALSLITLQQRAVSASQNSPLVDSFFQDSSRPDSDHGSLQLDSSVIVDARSFGNQIQYMITMEQILEANATVAQAQARLDRLIQALQAQGDALEDTLDQQEKRVNTLATQLETEQHQRDQLKQQRDLARSAYMALASQLEETRITLAQGDQTAKVAAQAWAPEEPSGPNTLMNTALAGVVGLILTVVSVYVIDWWQQSPDNIDEDQLN
jgi:uncharacterized protein involved in exopolysaccharide biosynthesis